MHVEGIDVGSTQFLALGRRKPFSLAQLRPDTLKPRQGLLAETIASAVNQI